AINTSNQTTEISLQPNPNAGSFKLILQGQSTSENGIITDILGNQVALLNLQTGMNEVHIENLPGGIYFLQIINSFGNRQSLKFIINK
ncbi:MAG: T9SS type A sorting domain-containing protein, partial [Bacteroidetes bacterium]|nr:T9SS type A sorting domain-containing protein [Bacteroidota bacterium]